jgi:Protein of unknown function (DUF2891)
MNATLTVHDAGRFARIVIGHATREYPNRLDQVLRSGDDVRAPRDLHPAFYGSFDWHSCVEGYWMLARLMRSFPDFPERTEIGELFDRQLSEANLAVEAAYANAPGNAGFERPYGWAWLLMLAAELEQCAFSEGLRARAALEPLARVFVERFLEYLPKASYPVRVGTHGNTAFACALAHVYAQTCGRADLQREIERTARSWYGGDRDAQVWEPSGNDFLSPVLVEAVCMQRVLEPDEFSNWFEGFLPHLAASKPETLFTPATVSDRSDGQIAHLDGLNLSRAWCWRLLSRSVPGPEAARMLASADAHLAASLPHVADDYMGEHWLAVYSVLALDA